MVKQSASQRTVKLTFNHDLTGPVSVVGTFNDWQVDATPMRRSHDGCWEVALELPAGEYEFRYFADGQWFTDYAADGVVPNGLGEFNSLLRVPDRRGATKSGKAGRTSRTKKSAKSAAKATS